MALVGLLLVAIWATSSNLLALPLRDLLQALSKTATIRSAIIKAGKRVSLNGDFSDGFMNSSVERQFKSAPLSLVRFGLRVEALRVFNGKRVT